MNNTTAAFDPAAAAASIETMNNILAPLTPLGRHLLASVGLLVGFFALLVGKKFMRTTLLLIGFSIGFCLSALICHQIAEPNVLLIVSVVVGGLLGFLAACVGYVHDFYLCLIFFLFFPCILLSSHRDIIFFYY